jgi:hypothetical protein
MLAHQLGYKLPDKAAYGIWRWEKLWNGSSADLRPARGSTFQERVKT